MEYESKTNKMLKYGTDWKMGNLCLFCTADNDAS